MDDLFPATAGQGHRVLVTSPPHVARHLIPQVLLTGARAFAAPTVRASPLDSYNQLDTHIGSNCSGFAWVVFRSAGCIQAFLMRCKAQDKEPAAVLAEAKVAVLCRENQLLKQHGVKVARVRSFSRKGTSFGVTPDAEATRVDLPGADNHRVLLLEPRLETLAPAVMEVSTEEGIELVCIDTYHIRPCSAEDIGLEELGWLRDGAVHIVASSSPAEVEALMGALDGSGWQLLEPVEHNGHTAHRLAVCNEGIRFCNDAGREVFSVDYSALQGWPVDGQQLTLVFHDAEPLCCQLSHAATVATEMQVQADAMAAEAGRRMVEELMGVVSSTEVNPRSPPKASAGLGVINIACIGEDTAVYARKCGLNVVIASEDEMTCRALLIQHFK